LYGATRRPTPEMLRDVDVLVVDLPDVGARYYTYISTTVELMQAAARPGIPVIVADRPNPIGSTVQGNLRNADTAASAMQSRPRGRQWCLGWWSRCVTASPSASRHALPRRTLASAAASRWRPPSVGGEMSISRPPACRTVRLRPISRMWTRCSTTPAPVSPRG